MKGRSYDYEVIAVDDGSRDGTVKAIEDAAKDDRAISLLKRPSNEGKGAAVRSGVLAAKGKHVFFMDADLSTPISEIDGFINSPGIDTEILIAVRDDKAEGTQVVRPLFRKVLNRIYNATVNMLLGLRLKDCNCGFKCFPSDIAKGLFKKQYIKRWLFDAELMTLAREKKIGIREIPVSWFNHSPSHLHIFRDSWVCFFELMKLYYHRLFFQKYYA